MTTTLQRIITLTILLLSLGYTSIIQAQNNLSYSVPFETAQSKLPQNILDSLVYQLETWQDYKIVLEGHTDNIGTDKYNQQLSQARVNEIQSILVQNNIDTNRIITLAKGATEPIADNNTVVGRAKNRRVDILLTQKVVDETLVLQKTKQLNDKLQKLMPKRGMTHKINPNKEQIIIAKQGTKIKVPAHAFDVPEGSKVLLKVTEAYRKSDMILQNLSTVSNGQALETGGMIKIEAFANGQPVQLKEGMALDIAVPAEEVEDSMQLFASEVAEDGSINWVQPQPLTRRTEYIAPNRLNWNIPIKVTYIPFTEREPKIPMFQRKPRAIDSTEYHRLCKRKKQLEENPYGSYKRYKVVKGIFGEHKVKKTKKDSLTYLEEVNRMIQSLKGKIQGQINRMNEKQKDHVAYQYFLEELKKHDAWQARKDSNSLVNLPIATAHRSLYRMKIYAKALKTKDFYNYWSKIYGIEMKNSYSYNDVTYHGIGDSLLCLKAIRERDTLAVNLMYGQKYKERLMLDIYQTKEIEEAYIAHIEKRAYNKYAKRAAALGISVKELIRKERIEAQWEEESKYLFQMANLGSYINCDFFPRMAPQEQLVTVQLDIPDTIGVTKTMMVFKKYNTVMTANVGMYTSSNQCSWSNIPLNEPVKIVSICMDEEGQMQVAIKELDTALQMEALEYKPMTEVEFLQALSGVNDVAVK